MPGTPRQTFRIDDYIWRQFVHKCHAEGTDASEVIREVIAKVLNGELSISSLVPKKKHS
jgi:hypothetical protein